MEIRLCLGSAVTSLLVYACYCFDLGHTFIVLVSFIQRASLDVVGLLSRIMVRKMGRRGAAPADGRQPVTVRPPDGAASDNGGGGGDVAMIGAADADVAREQFPFIFNLLRGHAINTSGTPAASAAGAPAPRAAAAAGPGQVSAAAAAENRRSKTSPHHHHHHQLQLQLQPPPPPPRKPAVSTCRQPQASPSNKGKLGCPQHSQRDSACSMWTA